MPKELLYGEGDIGRLKRTSEKLILLKDLAGREASRDHPREFLPLVKQGLTIARRSRKTWFSAFFALEIAKCYNAMWMEYRSFRYLLDASKGFELLRDEPFLHITQTFLADYHRFAGQYEEAITMCGKTLDYYRSHQATDSLEYLWTLIVLAEAHRERGDFISALDIHYQSLALCEGIEDAAVQAHYANVLLHLGITYYRMERSDKASELFNRAKEYELVMSRKDIVRLNMNIANIYNNTANEQSRALELYNSTAAIVENVLGKDQSLPSLLINIGTVHSRVGETDEAITKYQQAHDLAQRLAFPEDFYAAVFFNLGGAYWNKKDSKTALRYLHRGMAIAEKVQDLRILQRSHGLAAMIYEDRRNYKKALDEFKKQSELRNKLFGHEKRIAVETIERRIEKERVQRERERQDRKIQELESEQARKAQELKARSLHLSRKNALLNKLRNYLRKLNAKSDVSRESVVAAILTHVREGLDIDETWNSVEEEFHQVHSDFVSEIRHKMPTLTRTEIKICILLKMQLSAKDIAGILYLSVHTVYTHTKHIRSKLNLPSQQNLAAFLAGI